MFEEKKLKPIFWVVAIAAGVAIAFASASQSYVGNLMRGGEDDVRLTARWPLIFWLSWALLAPFVVELSSRHLVMRPFSKQHLATHVLAAIAFHLVHVGLQAASMRIIPAYTDLHGGTVTGAYMWHLTDSMYTNLFAFIGIASLTHLAVYYHRYRQKEIDSARLESDLVQAQLDTLRMQIQPHFLFNTLHSISTLMHKDVDAADTMLAELSDLLRISVDSGNVSKISVAEEIDIAKKYLSIEQVRFGDRLRVHFDIDKQLESAKIPSFLLQPLIENAIRHGISVNSSGGELRIGVKEDKNQIILTVTDSGSGLPAAGVQEGVGISNTRERLGRLYGTEATFRLENRAPSGVHCEIRIPRG